MDYDTTVQIIQAEISPAEFQTSLVVLHWSEKYLILALMITLSSPKTFWVRGVGIGFGYHVYLLSDGIQVSIIPNL